ncbi:pyridoxamine 5'-phosphate oxidase family protein [Geodermatophilus normandii]|uniref:Pyridoxamine 5'-phosphate oxidase family protein n=1 Tax=Geodermatophilus normandii TaxID=1137989 RepID=A0A6P0GGA7_9ACTN|nr:pyridoxamine 5'-phosphate oxidase family protein [Geodermatophilus normandii]NEM06266.1 pyridoxamine 5'-phosphate oxidase family protein [Geodermatophilus normandii]
MTGVHTSREELTDDECRRLLGTTSRGHLAFTREAMPAIAPVHYAVDGERLVIPARPDSEHLLPPRGAVVVLGIDEFDGESGWSVTVVGPARTVTDPAGVATWDALGWPGAPAAGDGHCYVVLQAGVLRGWRTLRASATAPRRSA